MKTILLPTDFSDNSWNAIEYALNLNKDTDCNFYLLHVSKLSNIITNDFPYIPDQDVIEDVFVKPAKTRLKTLLKKIVKKFPNNKKHNFYTLTDYNFFIESLRKHIKEKKVDMIIMGTKGASGLSKYIIGSNAGDVITKVKCTYTFIFLYLYTAVLNLNLLKSLLYYQNHYIHSNTFQNIQWHYPYFIVLFLIFQP